MKKIVIEGLTCPYCGDDKVDIYLHVGYNNVENYICICKGKCVRHYKRLLQKRIFFGEGNTINLQENPPYEKA